MREYGFCYVADCDAYIDEALRSIESLRKHMPDVPVTVVTHAHLFRDEAGVTDWSELRQTRNGPIVKSDAWLAPYECVAFLDTDTLILDDLMVIFPLLDRFDFVSVAEPNSRPERGIASGIPIAYPEPNSGFFAFRKAPPVERFFAGWIREYDRLNHSSGVTADQPALRIALWKSGLRTVMLGSEYNLILHANRGVSGRVAILHDRSRDRFRIAQTVNQDTAPRAVVPGFGPIFGFAGRRAWLRQYVRLSWNFIRTLIQPGEGRQAGHPAVWWNDEID